MAKTAIPEPPPQTVEQYRTENFEEMGFTRKEARRLARGRDAEGVPVRYDTVQTAMDNGCTPVQAVKIFGEVEESNATGDVSVPEQGSGDEPRKTSSSGKPRSS